MKKLIYIIPMLLIGCSESKVTEKDDSVFVGFDLSVKQIEIDSCEYIIATRTEAVSIIHKNNCKYCKN